MNYVGIDIHKRYSVCAAQDEQDRKLRVAQIEGNTTSGFVQFFRSLAGCSKVAIEVRQPPENWGRIHDLLEELEEVAEVAEVVVANPWKTRLIADAQIKTDQMAMLWRHCCVATSSRVHVPCKAVRQGKDELRQRLYWARLRTRVRGLIFCQGV